MVASTFDTLAYAKRLQDAGVDPKIAEAQAVALAEVLAEVLALAERAVAERAEVEIVRYAA